MLTSAQNMDQIWAFYAKTHLRWFSSKKTPKYRFSISCRNTLPVISTICLQLAHACCGFFFAYHKDCLLAMIAFDIYEWNSTNEIIYRLKDLKWLQMAENGLRVRPKVCIFVFDTFNRLFLAFTAVVCFDLSNFRADFFKTRFFSKSIFEISRRDISWRNLRNDFKLCNWAGYFLLQVVSQNLMENLYTYKVMSLWIVNEKWIIRSLRIKQSFWP